MRFYEQVIAQMKEQWISDLEHHWGRGNDALAQRLNLNPTNMNENKSLAGQPAVTETPAEQLNAGTGIAPTEKPSPDLAKLPEVADVLEEGIPAPDDASVIKHLFDELHEQVLNIRGAGAWEAELQHASAAAQTF